MKRPWLLRNPLELFTAQSLGLREKHGMCNVLQATPAVRSCPNYRNTSLSCAAHLL